MTYIDAIILGLVQGLTEFIPVSSSGHLVIASQILNIEGAFTFDVLLNFGTLLALIIYFRQRILIIYKKIFTAKEWKLLGLLMLATIPGAIVGLLFSDQIKELNENVWVVITMLVVIGVLMIVNGQPNKDADDSELEKSVGIKTSIKIGLAQALALIPGGSRSGLTIFAGLRSNLSAKKAAEFSFLLAIPIIFGASMKILLTDEGLEFVRQNTGLVLVGNLVSFIAGLLAVSFLINLLGKRGLKDFGWYRIGLATILICMAIAGII